MHTPRCAALRYWYAFFVTTNTKTTTRRTGNVSANKDYVDSLGVDNELAAQNMRLQTLCSLALKEPSNEVSYATIAEALQLDLSEVEQQVVKAIAAKVLDGKMDQLREVVVVHSCKQRTLADGQWEQMQTQLKAWRVNVENLLEVVKQRKKALTHGSGR